MEFQNTGDDKQLPSIGNDGTIYVGAEGLYAINPDGSQKWFHRGGFDVGYYFFPTSSPSIDYDGTIYIGGQINSFDSNYTHVTQNGLVAFNPNGTMKWNFSVEGGMNLGPLSSPAIGADGTIYFGALNDKFYAINSNGTKKWEIHLGSIVDSSPAIGADGTIFIGRNRDDLYALNPEGTIKWLFNGGGASLSSPVITTDGMLYVGGDSGYFAIHVDSRGLANSSWPMFGHDHFRSFNYNVETAESPGNIPSPPQMSYTFNGLKITITWESVSGATGYTLSYAPYPYSGPESIQSIDLGKQTSFSYDLWSGSAFYIAAQAYNDQGVSSYSNIEYFIIP